VTLSAGTLHPTPYALHIPYAPLSKYCVVGVALVAKVAVLLVRPLAIILVMRLMGLLWYCNCDLRRESIQWDYIGVFQSICFNNWSV